jgi:hypothetical protein
MKNTKRPKQPTAPKKKAKNQTAKERCDAFREDIVFLLIMNYIYCVDWKWPHCI